MSEKEFNFKSDVKLHIIYGNEHVHMDMKHPRCKDQIDRDHVDYKFKSYISDFTENEKKYTIIVLSATPHNGYFENEKRYQKELYISPPIVYTKPTGPFILKTIDGIVISKKENISEISIFETKVLYDTKCFDDYNTNPYHKIFIILENKVN